MRINADEIRSNIDQVRRLLQEETAISPALRSMMEMLLLVVTLLLNRVGLNSSNSSTRPSDDPNRKKTPRNGNGNKPGGQKGHRGTNLEPVADPDEIVFLKVDTTALPTGVYKEDGFESRQVFDVEISAIVTEYRAQVLVDQSGKRWVAPFPQEISASVQYGSSVKAGAVYMSQYQLLPYNRVEEQFGEMLQIPISASSVFNFNQDAYNRLEPFEHWAKSKLLVSPLLHADETGINIASKGHWLHCLSSDTLTFFHAHAKRGGEAMDDVGVLPVFQGILCHDHWSPYFKYGGSHALCNAHHLRELEWAAEQEKQSWAKALQDLLKEACHAKNLSSGCPDPQTAQGFRERYRQILADAETECPPPNENDRNGKRGRLKRTKSRNLLERLREHEHGVLLFLDNPHVPFSNNQAENDIRMTKVHQKISGCFRSPEGAAIFCRIRSFLSTCRKNGVSATQALKDLFQGKWPAFMAS
ncbi:MAG: IS66 family transposase [Magnetococcales bacterium]|nr:IS66 family transposase [Magnetococcales bacterium]MBF0115347.1 IS66 family transposase [Magnetococcales bacterium]